ncbi:phosphoenolpyruvate--protein phosphotransferase [[Mycoplasma] collis]|uniref:phosphoenolpyruvate--protein phosphotransferase n=1 Tax=[Mycoplasma] collis TaxID=2127 RepID=UPI00051B3420|nr:phosphoenolpyruvate--protein phosphotransferase [[Mycoplasma] collis]
MNKKLNGIAASNGIAIANVYKIDNQPLIIEDYLIDDVQREILLFQQAQKDSIIQIEKIKDIAAKSLNEEELDVLNSHILIANDPAIFDQIKELIETNKFNGPKAINQVKESYVEIFSSMDDEYMRERAADVKDVYERIIKNFLKIPIADLSAIDKEVIIVADDLTPSETAQLNKKYVKGFLTNIGGRTSHSAIMARTLEIPAILGLKNITEIVNNDDVVAINGNSGQLIINPSKEEIHLFEQEYLKYIEYKKQLKQFASKPSITKDGRQIIIASNIGSPVDVTNAIKVGSEAIGLFRSEFLYMDSENWPNEEEQFNAYKQVIEKMSPKQVVIRTLDIGGDKTLKYFKFPEEMNPFLGYRAIRMSLDMVESFRVQLRALIRASVYGNLAIMFPMISTINEFKQAKAIFDQEKAKLVAQGLELKNKIEVGMMVETPAAAVLTEQFCHYADFVSIGTNDLMQYSMAADRMNEKVSYLYQPLNPSILRLIKMTIDGAHKAGKWVGMCGEMAGDMNAIPLLLGMKLDEFSMSSSSVLEARKLISEINFSDAHKLMHKALHMESQEQVEQLLKEFFKK